MPGGEALGLAVSGGADSLGLLKLAFHRGDRLLSVATVDHGLRPQSRDEATQVASLCRSLGVPHVTLTIDAPIPPGNRQARARTARYAALARWAKAEGLGAVATGHQRDDQAETLAMRLVRGSGLAGLAGVRERVVMITPDAPTLSVIRPCLSLTRAELRALVTAAGWPIVDDPANADERQDRARMRRGLPADALPGLARSAGALAEAADALAWAEERAAERALEVRDGGATIQPGDLPPALLRALILRTVTILRPDARPPRGPEADRLLSALRSGQSATLRGLLFRPGTCWTVCLAPPARPRDCKPSRNPYLQTQPPAPDPTP